MRWTCALLFTTLFACDSPSTAPEGSAPKPGGSAQPAASSGTKSSGAPASSAADGPKLCEKADKLKKRIANIDAESSRIAVGSEIALPESKDGAPVSPMSPVVVIEAKDIRVNGESVGKPAGVKDKLQGQGSVLLAIPKGEEGIARVAVVVAALGPETEVYLLAALPGTKLEPAPRGLDLAGKGPSDRARLMAEALTKSIDGCPEAKKVFSRLATEEPAGRAKSVKQDLPRAVNACGCKVADDTEDMIAYLLGADPIVVGKKLKLSKEKDARSIKLKGLDGQKLYDALPADGSAVTLEM